MSNQKLFEEAMKGATKDALQMTFEQVAQLPPPQVIPYLTQLTVIAVELLRAGGQRDAFVREFLAEATRSLESPPFLTMKDLRVN
ncbi:hypothetical protein [Stenotrophomonas maltophilia]|uniref:hypothetical protein n=1 Tax=Stenotrophomonas maltophilia TaxID=40324 RepID=UPI001313AA6B|nr:hypothetical protein [Stenotrophomonas maltophilia]